MESTFNLVLALFHLTGMAPVPIHPNKSLANMPKDSQTKRVSLSLWSLGSLAALAILIVMTFTSDGIFGSHNYIGEFNDMIKSASIYTTHCIILVEAYLSRHHQSSFWIKIKEVDTRFLSQFEVVHAKAFEKTFARKFFLNVSAVVLVEVVIISCIQSEGVWSTMWYLTIVSLTVSRLRHLQLMLYVDTITFRLVVMRKELEEIVAKSQAEPLKGIKEDHLHTMCLMKNAYNTLYECCSHVNFSFGFSELFNLMQNFIQLTCDLYWVYSILYRNDLSYMLVLMLLLVPTFQVVIVTLNACERCLKEVREIGYLLHNVEKEDDSRMDTLIENFSLQILHEPFNISVSGFFNMDFTLLKAVSRRSEGHHARVLMLPFSRWWPQSPPTWSSSSSSCPRRIPRIPQPPSTPPTQWGVQQWLHPPLQLSTVPRKHAPCGFN